MFFFLQKIIVQIYQSFFVFGKIPATRRQKIGERRQFRMRVFRNAYFVCLRVPPAGLGYPLGPRED